MITTRFKRMVCMVLCLCMILQVIPVIASATEAGPVILRQPEDAAAALNEKFSVSVEAEGEGLTYQWYIKNRGSAKFSKSSIKSATYSTTMTKARAGREIYCVITDINGNSVVTKVVTLTGVSSIPLEITRQPVSASAYPGETIRVSLEAQGEGLKYQWYLRNKGSKNFSKSSIKSDTYTVTMNDKRDGREIYCVITDALGNVITSNTVTISKAQDEMTMFSPAPPQTPEVTEPVTEPVTETITEPVTETVTEPVTESATETVIESVTEPVTEPVSENATETVIEPVTEAMSETVTESVPETVTWTVAEPVIETEQPTDTETSTEIISESPAEPESEVVDITDKLNALMLKNGEELRRIRKEKGYLYACLYYYIKVTDAGDWDIKRTDEWKFEKGKTYVYQGVEMRMDDPGNIHFGYLGAILFHEEFVCFGAGLNNFMKFGRRDGDFYSYFDDPHDQIMMRWGYRMYKEGF